ncbi:hypothetical protein ISN45_Aa01g038540 [Arabidopsis thaliana x Arabidopsis arenosa]|uniref:Uncharacterized protein n=1 Tax=Arabidopsis thaliana x Arabidopsis arenosa TaxID=1240361 RepID=A0A8T2CA23_9BRAS|nr:hypothetical protein ISN45_Aa01g038540 [Arabidopsis thaliana x Arabidopsis arenosa]
MWSLQWFIFLLCYGVSYSPTTIRRGYRNSVDVIPLRFSSSGFHSSKFETERLHHGRVIDSAINVCHLRQISQSQIWDPGLSSLDFGNGGVTIRADLIKRSCLLLYLLIPGLYLSVWKRTTKFGEVDTFSFPAVALVNDPIPPNGVSEKKTNTPDATSPYAENISKRTKDFTSYANRRVIEPQILQERHQLWGRRQWIFQYHNMSSEVGDFFFSVLMLVDDAIREFQNLWSCDVTDGSQTLPFESVKDGTSTKNRCFPS